MCQHISGVHIEKSRTKSTIRRREHLLFAKYKGYQTYSYSAAVITPCQAVVPDICDCPQQNQPYCASAGPQSEMLYLFKYSGTSDYGLPLLQKAPQCG